MSEWYYPLIRVPIFYLSTLNITGPGVATRSFLSVEVDRGVHQAGEYWHTYGGAQLAIANASMPSQGYFDTNKLPVSSPTSEHAARNLAVVHVTLTLEDFEEFEFQVIESAFYPLLRMLGELAGAAVFLIWLQHGLPQRRRGRPACQDRMP